jgi:hypothetical protein
LPLIPQFFSPHYFIKNQNLFEMKNFFWALLLAPLFSSAQQNVVNANRVFPKVDKNAEFEKAIAAHAQKYHSGKWKWRIFEITSGPDYGGYHITEGPASWEDIDGRGDLGAEHTADWNKNVAIYLTDRQSSSYAVYQEELSSVALTDYSDWINITRITVNPGHMTELREWLTKMKKAWDETKSTVAVYSISSSGTNGYSIVTRYKQGLKERATGFRPPFRDVYEKLNGRDSWQYYESTLQSAVKESQSELLRFRADLSSK